MKNISVKIVVLLTGLVIGVNATGASDLPDCPSDENVQWHDCIGTFTLGNGNYVGEFKDGYMNGQGTATFEDGNKYVGEFKDGFLDGQGTFNWSNGDKYVGEWKDGFFNGQGTVLASGKKYVGEFKDGYMNGQGTATYADGSEEEGVWKDDIFLRTLQEEQVRQEKEDKFDQIYNACLLDKAADVDMAVNSLERALKVTCKSIAKDPSFLESLRYN